MSGNWQRVAAVDDIDEDEPISVEVGGHSVGVFRVDGEYYAIEDVCPHAYALLSQGFVDGEEVECPLHGAVFHIPSGKCLAGPAEEDVKTFPVRIEGDAVLVDLPD